MTSTMRPLFAEELRGAWHHFLDVYEPLRGELYRSCRHLPRSAWDAEELSQDAPYLHMFPGG
ncbi:MAG: hypothetical protein ACO1OB_12085 [Archangium sp.]